MKMIFCVPVLILILCAPVHAQEGEAQPAVMVEKRELILKFIDVFGTKRVMEQNLQTMFEDMGSDDPQTQKFKDNVRVDEIIEQLIPLYDKHFSADELKAYITFYSSAEGQKLLQTIPVLMEESVDISAKYFEEKFPVVPEDTDKNVTQ